MQDDFSKYFDSYRHRAPSWVAHVQKTGDVSPGLDAEDEKNYTRVTAENYPKIYNALKEECEFRGVEIPACYLDSSGKTRLGQAVQENYTLLIDARTDSVMNEKEMRVLMAHELKHLYQGDIITTEQSILAEYDSDRAVAGSGNYATIKSYVDKAIHIMIDEKVPTPLLRRFMHGIHNAFPGVIAENFNLQTDK